MGYNAHERIERRDSMEEKKSVPVQRNTEVTESGKAENMVVENKVPFRNTFDVSGLLHTAGQLKLTEQQRKILFAPVDPKTVEIRPDGLIYLPWTEYASRLTKAFGLGWALIPQGMPTFKANFIYWGFWLVIDGHYCGFAIGEQEYIPSNRRMTYGDACEGAKSNALMRLCKGLGISLELWTPSFVREWIAKYAETYTDERGRELWRKKGDGPVNPIPEEQPEERPDEKEEIKPPSAATKRKLWAMIRRRMKEYELTEDEAKAFYKECLGDPPSQKVASSAIEDFNIAFSLFLEKNSKLPE